MSPQPDPAQPSAAPGPVHRGLIHDVLSGVRFLGRGFGMWVTSPRLMFLGAIPALLVGIVYLAGIVLLIVNLNTVVVWATPFANAWAEPLIVSTRLAAALVFVIVAALFAVYTFTAVTLVVGDPFYERIWRDVEQRLGHAPADQEQSLLRAIGRGIGDGIRLLIPAIGVGILLLACGFIPLVGPIVVATVGALVGGWLLVVELTGFAFDARGFTLRQRRAALRSRRAVAVGFGAASYLIFLVPFAAIVAMPAAVAGAAMLSRDIVDRLPADGRPATKN
ncbi:EI24 domain-containing protein [Cryobacterium sp. 1639]|uniref:EI24 domain-containing protein n=1 Tax=Cryobacterium inferilacus TaxID=2866629 RepID=UPI001C735C03|nr:EI24 domain-containing protein [Cryobacterium sp. 1639]MBX0298601.1 EI24 domain-containing protein [Cryobacterium sp. 1639]